MLSYVIKKGKPPIEQVTLNLSAGQFHEIFESFQKSYPHYYAAALKDEYPQDDIMTILIAAGRECGFDL